MRGADALISTCIPALGRVHPPSVPAGAEVRTLLGGSLYGC